MSVREKPTHTTTDIACVACIAHLAEAELSLLPETDAEVVTEHRSQCPQCRLFTEQMDATREILASMQSARLWGDVADILGEARSDTADVRNELSFERLYQVAAVLDVEDADDLVQRVLVDAVSDEGSLDHAGLIIALIRAAAEQQGHPTESLNAPDQVALAYDPDGETAELFYPDFYDEGPDVGRFVESPNDWGHLRRLGPEEELETVELYKITDAAIDELPDVMMRLITLVDIEGVSLDDAASALGVSKVHAAQELNSGRVHVRGAIDAYLDPPKA